MDGVPEREITSYTRKLRWDAVFKAAIERGDTHEAIRIAVERIEPDRRKAIRLLRDYIRTAA